MIEECHQLLCGRVISLERMRRGESDKRFEKLRQGSDKQYSSPSDGGVGFICEVLCVLVPFLVYGKKGSLSKEEGRRG